jgi:hypothetical protein
MDEFIVSNIIDFLPFHTQMSINKQKYSDISLIFRNAKNTIVRSIRHHRHRINMIIETEDEDYLTLPVLRAHYILHYPDEYRWEYYKRAIDWKIKYDKNNLELYLYDVPISGTCTSKYLFKNIIMKLSLEELFLLGW